jgi:hypothetical protein
MKPVAWWITYRDDDGIPQLQVLPHPVHPDSPLAKRGGVAQEPLYTADLIERLAARVPDGCVVVPREPTPKMVDVTWNEQLDVCESHNSRNKRIYKAMIAAGEVKP